MSRNNIIRVKKDANYFVASNEPFNDQDLSWGARGIMGYLLSKPNDWEIRNYDLYRQSPAGRTATDNLLRELKDSYYLRRYKVNDDKGHIKWITEIYESKWMNPDYNESVRSPTVQKPTVGQPSDGQPSDGKPDDILSTELLSTELHIPDGNSDEEKEILDFPNIQPKEKRNVEEIKQGIVNALAEYEGNLEPLMEAIDKVSVANTNWHSKTSQRFLRTLRDDCKATPQKIQDFGQWWRANHWLGQKGSPPRLQQIYEEWPKFESNNHTGFRM